MSGELSFFLGLIIFGLLACWVQLTKLCSMLFDACAFLYTLTYLTAGQPVESSTSQADQSTTNSESLKP